MGKTTSRYAPHSFFPLDTKFNDYQFKGNKQSHFYIADLLEMLKGVLQVEMKEH